MNVQTIIATGIFQAILAIFLFVATKRKRQGEILLASGFIACLLHLTAKMVLLNVYGYADKGVEVSTFFQTTYCILNYVFIRKLTKVRPLLTIDLVIFTGFFTVSFANYVQSMYAGLTGSTLDTLLTYNYVNYWLFILVNSWFVVRTLAYIRYISSYWKEEAALIQQSSYIFALTNLFFVFILLKHSFPLDTKAILEEFARHRWVNYSILLYMALVIIWYKIRMFEAEAPKIVAEPDNPVVPEPTQPLVIPELNAREDNEAVIAQLERLMTEKRLYRDAELTLEKLASESGIYKHRISTALNQQAGKPFQVFVNEFRVKEVVEELEHYHHKDLTPNILMLAFDAGFNSKSSFNLNFKKVTGYSPTGYLGRMEKSSLPRGASVSAVL